MKTLTLTSTQLEQLREALVEQRGKFQRYLADASKCQQPTGWWSARVNQVDEILLLIAHL